MSDLTEDALTAVALVRFRHEHADADAETAKQYRDFLIGDRTEEEVRELLFHLAGLTGVILRSWHKSIVTLVPDILNDIGDDPTVLLDSMVTTIVTDEPESEEG